MAKKKFFTETSLGALIDEIKSYVESKVSGKANKTIVGTITYDTSLKKYVCDKTYEELYAAHSSGQTIELHSSSPEGSYVYSFMGSEPSVLIFSNFYNNINFVYRIYHDSETNTDHISELYFPFVNSEEGVMTGALALAGDPTENLHAATKQYVDFNVANIQNTLDDCTWNLIYDSGAISSAVNSFANINVSDYNNFMITVSCLNSGNPSSKAGSVIFKASNGTTYQFPVWGNLFSASTVTNGGMAQFKLIDGYLVCPSANRVISGTGFLDFSTEGGTAKNLIGSGGGIMKCTNAISSVTVSSLDQDANYFFGAGSRLMIWGWKA